MRVSFVLRLSDALRFRLVFAIEFSSGRLGGGEGLNAAEQGIVFLEAAEVMREVVREARCIKIMDENALSLEAKKRIFGAIIRRRNPEEIRMARQHPPAELRQFCRDNGCAPPREHFPVLRHIPDLLTPQLRRQSKRVARIGIHCLPTVIDLRLGDGVTERRPANE